MQEEESLLKVCSEYKLHILTCASGWAYEARVISCTSFLASKMPAAMQLIKIRVF